MLSPDIAQHLLELWPYRGSTLLTYALFCLTRSCLFGYLVPFAFLFGCHAFSPVSPSRSHDPRAPRGVGRLPVFSTQTFLFSKQKRNGHCPFLRLHETTQTSSLVLSCMLRASEAARQGQQTVLVAASPPSTPQPSS